MEPGTEGPVPVPTPAVDQACLQPHEPTAAPLMTGCNHGPAEPQQHEPTSSEPHLGQTAAEVFGEAIPDLHLKLWDIFDSAASLYPDHDALVSLWQPQAPATSPTHNSYLRWSYAELKEKAETVAGHLHALGCRQGMRLAVVFNNSAEWALFFWVAAKLQMAFVPIDPTVPRDARATIASLRPHVVVTQDADAAVALDLAHTPQPSPSLRIHCSDNVAEGWTRLCHVQQQSASADDVMTDGEVADIDEDISLIVFTSGTTGEPKGCVHTHENIVSECCDFDPEVDPNYFLRFLIHTPSSHIFAINNALRAWRWGGTAIFASKTFNVDATLQALVQEQCSVMSATPTLVKALMAHPSFPSPDELDLRIVTIGGTSIGREDIELCCRGLGARIAIQVYGMSEGAPLITFARTDPDLVNGYHPGVGKVLAGAAARICRPGSREPVRRGEIGELHMGGTSIITRYYNRERDESMYSDEHGSWLVTGDQARMDEQGVIYILGRYKDLIIRGGENIYPIKIETALQQIPGVQAQVVGVPDELAGQVPVAVAILPEDTTKAQLIEKSRSIDPRYALDSVYTLEELGYEKFPVTSLGKVKKALLRQKLEQMRQPKEPQPSAQPAQPSQRYIEKLTSIWEQLCGTRPDKGDNVMFLADSITLLRYCDSVLRTCGQRLYLQDFAENETVEKQAHLLMAREIQEARMALEQGAAAAAPAGVAGLTTAASIPHMQAPLAVKGKQQQLPVAVDEKGIWKSAQDSVASAGLACGDIEDVMVVRDSLHRTAIGPRPQSYHNRVVFRVRDVPYEKIRLGLEKALSSRPMLRAIVFEAANKVPYHAVLSASPALFGKLIRDVGVETEAEALELAKEDSCESHSTAFMSQSDIVRVGAAGDQYMLIFTFNHSVFDALSITQWHHELDRWIQDANVHIPALTPYRLFSDLFSQYEDSEPAQKSVAFHVKRLRGISRFGRALWPPQRAPGMMISHDGGSAHADERRAVRDRVWGGQWEARAAEFQYPRSGRIVALPGLAALRDQHGVLPALFAKSAVVLFNVLQTGSSHALFNSWESGRSWPFVPEWMERLLPPAMSIDGPTVQWLLNMCEVVADETVAGFMRRMAGEQDQMKRFEHVPWNRVLQGLRDEGDMAEAASFRQSFVWDVSMAMSMARGDQTNFKTLEPVTRYDWPDCGLFWNAFMIDAVNLYFIASWDTAQMNDVEVDTHCDSLADVMRKLADERNWDKKVGEVFAR